MNMALKNATSLGAIEAEASGSSGKVLVS